jgi:hypothetical protein
MRSRSSSVKGQRLQAAVPVTLYAPPIAIAISTSSWIRGVRTDEVGPINVEVAAVDARARVEGELAGRDWYPVGGRPGELT